MIPTFLGVMYYLEFPKAPSVIVIDVHIASYADDNTVYDSCNTIEEIILSLKCLSTKRFQWLSDNQTLKRVIMSTNESVEFQLGSSLIELSEGEKMILGNI